MTNGDRRSRRVLGPALPRIGTGPGFVRLDLLVVVPDLAIAGSPDFEFAVLQNPETGGWFGEEKEHPGSFLVPLEKASTAPATPAAIAVLTEVADFVGRMRTERAEARERGDRSRVRGMIEDALRPLPTPSEAGHVIDFGRLVDGTVPPPAIWQRIGHGALLIAVADDDATRYGTDRWASAPRMLALETPESRIVAERLGEAIRLVLAETPPAISWPGRTQAIHYLEEHAPAVLSAVTPLPSGTVVDQWGEIACPTPFDVLTGLGHRGATSTIAPESAVAYIDIVRFIDVNDGFGHAIGDRVLRTVAGRLRAAFAPWRLFRDGGDAFVMEVAEPLDHDQATDLALRIRALIAEPIDGVGWPIEVTVGIVLRRQAGDVMPALDRAEDAFERARAADLPFFIAAGE